MEAASSSRLQSHSHSQSSPSLPSGRASHQDAPIRLLEPRIRLLSYRIPLSVVRGESLQAGQPSSRPANDASVAPASSGGNHAVTANAAATNTLPASETGATPSAQSSVPSFHLAAFLLGVNPTASTPAGHTPGAQTPISTLANTLAGATHAPTSGQSALGREGLGSTASSVHPTATSTSLSPIWRVRWACYSRSPPPLSDTSASLQVPGSSFGEVSNTQTRQSSRPSTSQGRGIRPGLSLRLPSTHSPPTFAYSAVEAPPSSLLPPYSSTRRPLSARPFSATGKRRARADSSLSQRSSKRPRFSSSYSTNRQNPDGAPNLEPPWPGLEASHPLYRLLSSLRGRQLEEEDPFFVARRQWSGQGASPDNSPEVTGGVKSQGKKGHTTATPRTPATLPNRLFSIHADLSDGAVPTLCRKLWLFAITPLDNREHVNEMLTDSEFFGSYANLDLQSSGSFTSQDLFPSLYNENGLYASPSSRPARLMNTCLMLSGPANAETAQASEQLLRAVREHLEQDMVDQCHPSGLEQGLKVGDGILWPIDDSDSSATPGGLYCALSVHFDHEGIVASVSLSQCHARRLTRLCLPDDGRDDGRVEKRSDILPGQQIVLLPLGLSAVFCRHYGTGQSRPIKQDGKVASTEQLLLSKYQQHMATLPQCEYHTDNDQTQWLLCTIGDEELLWPSAMTLMYDKPSEKTGAAHQSGLSSGMRPKVTPNSKSLIGRHSRVKQLVAQTSAYIDRIGREKERERREKAERSLGTLGHDINALNAKLDDDTVTLTNTSSDSKHIGAAVPSTNSSTVERSVKQSASRVLPRKTSSQPARYSAMRSLDKLAALLPPLPPTPRASEPVATQSFKPFTSAGAVRESNHPHAAGIEATDEAGQSSHSRAGEAVDIGQVSTLDQGNMFRDFMWDDYGNSHFGSNDTLRETNFSSSVTFADGIGNMFDGPLTEDDFSFFDTPAIPTVTESLQQYMPTSSRALDAASTATASADLAFVTASGPVDHFSHLMPTGNSPASVPYSASQPSRVLPMDYVSQNLMPYSTFDSESPSFGLTFAPSPQIAFEWSATKQTASDTFTSFLTPSSDQQHATDNATAYNHITELDDNTALSLSRAAVGIETAITASPSSQRRKTVSAFQPLTLSSPAAVSSQSMVSTTSLRPALKNNENANLAEVHRIARANNFRTRFLKSAATTIDAELNYNRNWIIREDAGELVFDESSTSSEDSSDNETPDDHPMYEASPFPQTPLTGTGHSAIGPYLILAGSLMSSLSRSQVSSESALDTKDIKDKNSRTAKEALITVFFTQLVENPDFRERCVPHVLHTSAEIAERAYPEVCDTDLLPYSTIRPPEHVQQTFISLMHHMAVMRMSLSAIKLWEKVALQPMSGPKDVKAFVTCASSLATDVVRSAIVPWLENVASVYKSCGLGHHSYHTYEDQDDTLPLISIDTGDKLLSNLAEQNLLDKMSGLSAKIIKHSGTAAFGVVYILVEDAECSSANLILNQICLRLHLIRRGLIPHLVPISLLSRSLSRLRRATSARSGHDNVISRLAFAIYDRLQLSVSRFEPPFASILMNYPKENPNQSTRLCCAPAFKIIPQARQQVAFTLQWPPPTLDILDRNRILHVAYAISADKKWIALATIDEKGENYSLRSRSIEGLDAKTTLRRVWAFAKEFAEVVSVEWRIVITKAGFMPSSELVAWTDLLQTCVPNLARPAMVSVCSIGDAVELQQGDEPDPFDASAETASGKPAGSLYYADSRTSAYASFANHPVAVYEEAAPPSKAFPIPFVPPRAYYALSSASIYFVDKLTPVIDGYSTFLSDDVPRRSPRSYAFYYLLTVTHNGSTYPHSLARHMRDVAQSFVDLQALGRERWSLCHRSIEVYPYHLAAVLLLARYDIDSLLRP